MAAILLFQPYFEKGASHGTLISLSLSIFVIWGQEPCTSWGGCEGNQAGVQGLEFQETYISKWIFQQDFFHFLCKIKLRLEQVLPVLPSQLSAGESSFLDP